MTWLTRTLLLLGLLAQLPLLTLAKTTHKDKPAAAPPIAGSKEEDLAYEQIHKSQIIYTSNTTSPSPDPNTPPTSGWWSSQICSQQTYCIYTNLALGHGRGIVLLTKFADFQKIERLDQHLDKAEDRIEQWSFSTTTTTAAATSGTAGGATGAEEGEEGKEKVNKQTKPFEESYILDKGPGLTATVQLRRGKPLMQAAPVLVVHKDFFADIWRKSERAKMLEKAVSFLPPATREAFDRQRTLSLSLSLAPGPGPGPDGKETGTGTGTGTKRSIEQILLASPFEIDLGSNSYTPLGSNSHHPLDSSDHSKHYINYPSLSLFTHSCRPNIAFHIDSNLALRTTVARKVSPGEELSIAYIDPLGPRKERQEWVGRYRPHPSSHPPETGCPCPACSGHNYPSILSKQHGHPHTSSPAKELAKSDARLAKLENIRSELRKGHESHSKVTPEMIEKFLRLHVEEGLETKMAEAYELAATNYNYLGEDDRKAKKYADLAVQAARIEYGRDANDVIAMRIMAGDVRGHWSYQYKVKRMGG